MEYYILLEVYVQVMLQGRALFTLPVCTGVECMYQSVLSQIVLSRDTRTGWLKKWNKGIFCLAPWQESMASVGSVP